jgi:hypothetical protein
MFSKILIANRGDKPQSGEATKSDCIARTACTGE